MAVALTLIRHGESTDNTKAVWAGRKDATLTNHGMNQANALGAALAATQFVKILSSPLKRAKTTAEAVQQAQATSKPPIVTSLLLREQHFGTGEGKSYAVANEPALSLEEHYAQGNFPSPRNRSSCFPGGESLNDVASRAEQAIDELLIPKLEQAVEEDEHVNVAIVSHGIFLAELLGALVKRRGGIPNMQEYRGMRNTGWTRVLLKFETMEPNRRRLLHVRITHTNQYGHLNSLVRQKGGIGSAGYDPKQKDIRTFFGGSTTKERKA